MSSPPFVVVSFVPRICAAMPCALFLDSAHSVYSKEPVEFSTSASTASLEVDAKDFAGWSGLKQLADEGATLSVLGKAGFNLKTFGKNGQIIIKMSESRGGTILCSEITEMSAATSDKN